MKRFTALLLSLIILFSFCACGVNPSKPGNETVFTEPPAVTAPDGRPIYSKEPIIEYPQTGEYKETALLANVPGQGVPLLLDMRSDGTIDYIFADIDDRADLKNCAESGMRYYTIAPDGTATKQNTKWMEELDNYLQTTLETTQDPNGKWRLLFTSDEGTILILAQYHSIVMDPKDEAFPSHNGDFLYSTLLKVVSDTILIIPLEWEFRTARISVDLRSEYISSIEFEDEQITISKRDDPYFDNPIFCEVSYHTDGTLISAQIIPDTRYFTEKNIHMDETGIMVQSLDLALESETPQWFPNYVIRKEATDRGQTTDSYGNPWQHFATPEDIQYTEDDTLYYLGKQLPTLKAVTYGKNKDFCCWFDEAGTGLLMRYTYNPEGKIDPEVLTVWSWEPINLVKTAVAQWNHTHASPIFRYETATKEMEVTNLTEDDILTRLNLELLNNKGPDVMILDGLDVDSYLDFMAPLDRVSTDGVYQSILDRFTVGDDLLALPARISPYLLGRKEEGTQNITSLAQFADEVTATAKVVSLPGNKVLINMASAPYYVEDYHQLFQLWYPAWADAIWENGKLNRDVFAEFLTYTTQLSKLYGLRGTNIRQGTGRFIYAHNTYERNLQENSLDFYQYLWETDGYMKVKPTWIYPYTLAAPNHVGLYHYWCYNAEAKANQHPIPHYIDAIPGPDDTGAAVPAVIAGVRAGGNEAAGQEFVQILLSRELQLGGGYHSPSTADGYPVMWHYTEELINETADYMSQDISVLNDYSQVMNELRTVIIDETLFQMALYAASCCYRDEPDQDSIDRGDTWEVLTVDEAVDVLDELSRIYLAEKR